CNYMETRACVAEYSADDDMLTLTLGSQGVYSIRMKLCDFIMDMDPEKMRVVTPDVGGGFGTKLFMYHEYPLCLAAAKKLNRPVRWFSDRTEHFLTDVHGRDNITTARLGLDKDNRFVALDVEILADMGAYLSDFSTIIPWFGASMATGLYDIGAAYGHVKCIYTNTTPTDAYRGAGRPEAAYLLERLVDYTALELGVDANELRRINFIKENQFPYKTPTGRTIDVGEFEGHMTRAMDVGDWNGFEARRAESVARGKLRGIGLASYIEACAFAGSEPAHVSLQDDGSVFLRIGTQSTGQGHQTAYAQFIAAQLDLDPKQIHVHQGDTDVLNSGGGTGGSRSIPIGGVSVNKAAHELGEKLREIASDKLEASVDDLEFSGGFVEVVGTDRRISFADIAVASDEPLTGTADIQQEEATYPNGTHVCELEVDPNTGVVELLTYTVVDDFGVTVNPLLLAGQVHGGIVQGIGQALYERTEFDESGQLLTASFMDYGIPRADHFPDFHFETRNVPSTTNALGIKGAGEAGAIGSTPAVMNALVNALHSGYGIKHIDMPALPHVIWGAIEGAK
ncbi:MAG: molybdopterin cofactor-binding domain-containing protein, partial [Hyphomicrobiales bacterium]